MQVYLQKKKRNYVRYEDREQILAKILSYLPVKSLCKMKCVSKRFYHLIAGRFSLRKKAIDAGFLLQQYLDQDYSLQWTFFRIDDKGRIFNRSFHIHAEHPCFILDSCKGLILYKMSMCNESALFVRSFHSEQSVPLPPSPLKGRNIRCTGYGLAVDGPCYKVIHFTFQNNNSKIEWGIHYSKTCRWIERYQDFIFPEDLPRDGIFMKLSTCYSKGNLHWIWGGYMLVYSMKNWHFMLIKLPQSSSGAIEGTFSKCMWESKGCLHYCHGGYRRIQIWKLLIEKEMFRWIPQQNVDVVTMKALNPEIFLWMIRRILHPMLFYFEPFAFDEDYHLLYLRVHQIFLTLDLQNGKLNVIFSVPFIGRGDCHLELFPYVYGFRTNLAPTNAIRTDVRRVYETGEN